MVAKIKNYLSGGQGYNLFVWGPRLKTIAMMADIQKRFAVKACLENASYYFNSGKGWPFLQWLRRWQPILIMANIKVPLWLKWPRLKIILVMAKLWKPYLIFSYWTRMACALKVAYTSMVGVANIEKLSCCGQVEETVFNLFTV
jgi:hypothetical protein